MTGTAVWVTPQVVAVPVAWANPPHSRPSTQPRPKGTLPPMGPPLPDALPGTLAWTGQNTQREVEVATAAVVAGAVIWVANRPTDKREMDA